MDPEQVIRDPEGRMRCRQCGFAYDLDPPAIAEATRAGLKAVETALDSVPESDRGRRVNSDVWSVNAYMAHLATAVTVITGRVRAIAEEDEPYLAYYDQDEEAEQRGTDSIPAGESLQALEQSVPGFIALVESLPAAAWQRHGRHERAGTIELVEIAHDMPHELRHHADDIRSIGEQLRAPGG